MYDILQLNDMLVPELREVAERLEVSGFRRLAKQELIHKILDQQAIVGNTGSPDQTPTKEEQAPEAQRPVARRTSPGFASQQREEDSDGGQRRERIVRDSGVRSGGERNQRDDRSSRDSRDRDLRDREPRDRIVSNDYRSRDSRFNTPPPPPKAPSRIDPVDEDDDYDDDEVITD